MCSSHGTTTRNRRYSNILLLPSELIRFVPRLTLHPYHTTIQELQELLEHGDAAKRRAATAMNERSTRAHTVFVLSLQARRGRFEAWAWSS